MGALVDLIIQQTDPVTALLLVVIAGYTRQLRNDFKQEHREQRRRIRRIENELIDDNET